MSRPACSAGGESWKRSASWAGYTAGNTNKSAEKVSASRNRGSLFFICMMIIASWIPSLVISNCRFFVPHRKKPTHKEAGSLFADSPSSLWCKSRCVSKKC